MNNLQLEARTAPAEDAFTARELDAAEQLVHLSASSSSSGAPVPMTAGRAPAASRSTSSPRSVNAPPAPAAVPVLHGGCADWEEGEEREVAGSQRRVKRFRLIAEIYAATEEIGARGGRSSRKNKKE